MFKRFVAVVALAAAVSSVQAADFNLGFDPIKVGLPGTTGATNFINPPGWNLPADNTWEFGYGPINDDNIEGNPYFPAEVFFQHGKVAVAIGSLVLGSDTLVAGNTYTISVLTNSVLWGDGPIFAANPEIQTSITAKTHDGTLLGSQILVNSVSDLVNWPSHDFTFVAPAGTDGKYLSLEFTSSASAGDAYGLISGISATTGVPEPTSLGLLATGGLLALRRRRAQ